MHPTAIDIRRKIRTYHGELVGNLHHRYRSWEHCYGYFQKATPARILEQRDHAALQLGFYLASWGMYRGSGFLLQHAYSVHLAVVDCLASPAFKPLWEPDIGSKAKHRALTPIILAAVEAVRHAYAPVGQATDTLISKVVLGTFGCLPACDRLFRDGFTRKGFRYSTLNAQFVDSCCASAATTCVNCKMNRSESKRAAA
jgi:hypothetical protein